MIKNFNDWQKSFRSFIASLIWNPSTDRMMMDFFKRSAEQFDASEFTVLTSSRVRRIIIETMNPTSTTSARDRYYYTIPDAVFNEFSKLYKDYRLYYKSEVFDCDNFSIDYLAMFARYCAMIPNAKYTFALAVTSGDFSWVSTKHQVNIGVFDDESVLFIEPQNNSRYAPVQTDKVDFVYV